MYISLKSQFMKIRGLEDRRDTNLCPPKWLCSYYNYITLEVLTALDVTASTFSDAAEIAAED